MNKMIKKSLVLMLFSGASIAAVSAEEVINISLSMTVSDGLGVMAPDTSLELTPNAGQFTNNGFNVYIGSNTEDTVNVEVTTLAWRNNTAAVDYNLALSSTLTLDGETPIAVTELIEGQVISVDVAPANVVLDADTNTSDSNYSAVFSANVINPDSALTSWATGDYQGEVVLTVSKAV